MVDFHLIMDLIPTIAKMFFLHQTLPKGAVNLSYVQAAILIGIGLQFKSVEDIERDIGLNAGQILPQFNKMVRKFTKVFQMVYKREIEEEMDEQSAAKVQAISQIKESLNEELK